MKEIEKVQTNAERKEKILKSKKNITIDDAKTLGEIDEVYFDSIKAKLNLLKINTTSNASRTN